MGLVLADHNLQEALENVGKGWHHEIYQLYMLRQFHPTVKVAQVKEKFGQLRFYVDGGTDEWYNAMYKIIKVADTKCEICGRPGKTRPTGWIMTLCWRHYAKMLLFNKYVRRNKVKQMKSILKRRLNANRTNNP